MDEVARLALDRRRDQRVAVAGRRDGYARGEVQEHVAVDVLDGCAAAAYWDERVGPRETGRGELVIEGDVASCLGPWDRCAKVRNRAEIGSGAHVLALSKLGHVGSLHKTDAQLHEMGGQFSRTYGPLACSVGLGRAAHVVDLIVDG